jgi:RNA polymerase sigma factor (sigma-70 family)
MNDSRRSNRQTGVTHGRAVTAALDSGIEPPAAFRAGAQDERAKVFRALVGAALDDAYRRATVILGDRFEAEDAVHDAAVKAWRSWRDLRDPDRFEAWFGRILLNTCRDRLRSRRRVARIEVGEDLRGDLVGASGLAERSAEADRVQGVLATLAPDERIAVVLRYEADLTVPAIAALVGVPEGTVKSRLHHALRTLRARLEEDRG